MATKPKKIWDNYEELGEVRKSDGIKFVIAAATREGFRYINIREFYMRKRDQVWMPGRDGITIPIIFPMENGAKIINPADDMIDMLTKAKAAASTIDLADEDKAVWYQPKEK